MFLALYIFRLLFRHFSVKRKWKRERKNVTRNLIGLKKFDSFTISDQDWIRRFIGLDGAPRFVTFRATDFSFAPVGPPHRPIFAPKTKK